MKLALSLLLLGLLVLQQTIDVQSLISPIQSADNEAGRPSVSRRLRAPLMGRSSLSVSSTNDDDVDVINNGSSSTDNDEEEFHFLNKRRNGAPLFGRRYIPTKRRGPLFG